MGKLRFCFPQLLDVIIAEGIFDHIFPMSPRELVTLLHTLALFDYKLENINDILISYVFPQVNETSLANDSLWLNFVWSLAVLQKLTPYHAKSVVNLKFMERLLSSVEPGKHPFITQKVLRIKTVAEIELKQSMEPLPLLRGMELPSKAPLVQNLDTVIIETLNNFLSPKYMESNLRTPLGIFITGEFIINKALVPLPLSEYGVMRGDHFQRVKPLPVGYKRVAIITTGFKDYLLHESRLTGDAALVVRILKKQGYSPVVINQNEFLVNSTAIRRVQNIQQTLKQLFCDN
jgi:hypothetical protein